MSLQNIEVGAYRIIEDPCGPTAQLSTVSDELLFLLL